MSASVDQAVKKFIKTIRNDGADKRYSYNRTAKVVRKEGDTAWVSFDGVNETPARLDVGAKLGDTVTVRVADGRAWVTGNNTEAESGGTAAAVDEKKFKLKIVDGQLKLIINNIAVSTVEIPDPEYTLEYEYEEPEEPDEDEEESDEEEEDPVAYLRLLKDGEVVSEVEMVVGTGDFPDGVMIRY